MDKFFDTIGAVAQASAPLAAAVTFSFMAAAIVVGVGLAWGLPRLGRMLRVPQYQPRRPNYFGTPAE